MQRAELPHCGERIFYYFAPAMALWQGSRGHGGDGVSDSVMTDRAGFKAENARVWIFFRNFASALPLRPADDSAGQGAQYE